MPIASMGAVAPVSGYRFTVEVSSSAAASTARSSCTSKQTSRSIRRAVRENGRHCSAADGACRVAEALSGHHSRRREAVCATPAHQRSPPVHRVPARGGTLMTPWNIQKSWLIRITTFAVYQRCVEPTTWRRGKTIPDVSATVFTASTGRPDRRTKMVEQVLRGLVPAEEVSRCGGVTNVVHPRPRPATSWSTSSACGCPHRSDVSRGRHQRRVPFLLGTRPRHVDTIVHMTHVPPSQFVILDWRAVCSPIPACRSRAGHGTASTRLTPRRR